MEIVRDQSEKDEELSEIPPVPKKYGEHYPPHGWVAAKMIQSIRKLRESSK
jgi:hypothetical protein